MDEKRKLFHSFSITINIDLQSCNRITVFRKYTPFAVVFSETPVDYSVTCA
jgi:hypothetical protein